MDYSPAQCKQICELTYQYAHKMVFDICKDADEATRILARYTPATTEKHKSLHDLYQHFCHHAQNTSHGGNVIRKVFGATWQPERHDRWQILTELVQGFDPHKFAKKFATQLTFAQAVYRAYPDDAEQGFAEALEEYIGAIFELGHFFAKFDDGEAVYAEFDTQYAISPTALVRHLQGISGVEENPFFGLGDALLRDALKELGYTKYVKADTHIKEVAKKLGISTSDDESVIAEDVALVAELGGVMTPYELDKYIFLIGSGNFYQEPDVKLRDAYKRKANNPRKNYFVRMILEKLNS